VVQRVYQAFTLSLGYSSLFSCNKKDQDMCERIETYVRIRGCMCHVVVRKCQPCGRLVPKLRAISYGCCGCLHGVCIQGARAIEMLLSVLVKLLLLPQSCFLSTLTASLRQPGVPGAC